MIRACLFDLDGVIVDTARYHYLAWKRLAAELGFDFSERDNERLKGVSRMASLEILLQVGGMGRRFSPAEKEAMAAQKNAGYVEYISRMTRDEILPGAKEFLERLRSQGIRTALGSASRNAPLILERTGIAPLFDAVVDGTVVSEAKPAPDVFLKGAEELGVPPAACVVFEDAEAGVEAARRGGMRCIGIGSPGVLRAADAVIPGFEGFTPEKMRKLIRTT
jgi:beta-phosphoglucomutase